MVHKLCTSEICIHIVFYQHIHLFIQKTRCVTLEIPHNSACQLYDYKNKNARVVFGPEMVVLQPDEQFTLLSLSAGKPKKPNQIRSLVLLLGPDFCTDTVEVETVDHARLRLVFKVILLSRNLIGQLKHQF